MFEKIWEDREVYSFDVGDLNARQASGILQKWGEAGDNTPLSEITVCYDPVTGRLLINRAAKSFEGLVKLADAALTAPTERLWEVMDKIRSKEELKVIIRFKDDTEAAESVKLLKKQPVRDDAVLRHIYRDNCGLFSAISAAYSWGVIKGKRLERARRRRAETA